MLDRPVLRPYRCRTGNRINILTTLRAPPVVDSFVRVDARAVTLEYIKANKRGTRDLTV